MELKGPTARILILISVIVTASGTAGYLWIGTQEPQRYVGPVETVVLGAEASLLPAAVWVAEDLGYFEDEGLDLTIRPFDSGRSSFMAMLAGEVDLATVAPTPIMFASFEREDFTILATFAYSDEDVKVIARKDSGINIPTDLIGKKVGTPAGTTGEFVLNAFLIHHGLLASDVETFDITPTDLPTALDNNRVDAIVIWEPHAFTAQRLLGNNSIRLATSGVYRETFNFVAMKDFVEANSEVLRRFLVAVDRASAFVEDNKEESQNIVADRLGLDQQVLTVLWDDFVFEISLDQSLILTLEDEARWAIKEKLTDHVQVPNYLNYIHPDALEKVRPGAVTIIG